MFHWYWLEQSKTLWIKKQIGGENNEYCTK